MIIKFDPKRWSNTILIKWRECEFRYDREYWYIEIYAMLGKREFYFEKAFKPYCPLCNGSGGFHGSELEPPELCGYCREGYVTPRQWLIAKYWWSINEWLWEHTHTECPSCSGLCRIDIYGRITQFDNQSWVDETEQPCLNCNHTGFLPFWRGGWRGVSWLRHS
jgi:hypothetical protein